MHSTCTSMSHRDTHTHSHMNRTGNKGYTYIHVHESTRMEDRTGLTSWLPPSGTGTRMPRAPSSSRPSYLHPSSHLPGPEEQTGVTQCTYICTCTCTTLHGQHLHGLGICTIYVYTYNVYMVVGRSALSSCSYQANRIDSHAHKT